MPAAQHPLFRPWAPACLAVIESQMVDLKTFPKTPITSDRSSTSLSDTSTSVDLTRIRWIVDISVEYKPLYIG